MVVELWHVLIGIGTILGGAGAVAVPIYLASRTRQRELTKMRVTMAHQIDALQDHSKQFDVVDWVKWRASTAAIIVEMGHTDSRQSKDHADMMEVLTHMDATLNNVDKRLAVLESRNWEGKAA